jgi:hypothetical protein
MQAGQALTSLEHDPAIRVAEILLGKNRNVGRGKYTYPESNS